ncbi:hypothetical protein N665_0068s0005 [Sinapis alba]|nr:hypothetical protein N665_0068s0005 [Sinapis alba]
MQKSKTVCVPLLLSLSSATGKFFLFGVDFSFLLKANLHEVSPSLNPKHDSLTSYFTSSFADLLTIAVVVDHNFTASLPTTEKIDSIELPKRIFTLGEEHFSIKSIAYHIDDSKLFSAVRDALHNDEYEELKETRLGVFLKFKELDFEFEHLTGLNCEYIENLENLRCEVTKEIVSLWERIGVSVDVGPCLEQIIRACQRYQEWSRDDRIRLRYLTIFTGFIERRIH